ncbi:M81 family metallopeptidase [Chloroflexi bacterium TSY]|nr:M81 family metallopeptidase [Chloroflexi bacterium TSY]
MRIAIAGFMHESNTFAAIPTTLDDFSVLNGTAMVDHYAPTFHEVAGFIAGADEFDYDLHPIMAADATPAGPLTNETYEALVNKILEGLDQASDVNGLLLALHGAMVAEGYPQANGETVRRIRAAMGPDFPVVVTHDYHGNIPEQLVRDATALIVYKTCPHIDQRERGLQAASILERTIRGEIRPKSAIAKPDLLFNIMFHNTSQGPMQPLMDAAIALEEQSDILACSIAAGYQYADVPTMGPSIVVVTDDDAELAEREAKRLGAMMWESREQLLLNVPKPAEAVQTAIASTARPIALFELGDNVGGGSAGDATALLKELVEQQADGWVVTIYDPESVSACFEAGIGAMLSLVVGGKTDNEHGPTIPIAGRVRTLHNGHYEEHERRHGGGRYFSQGLTAVVEAGRSNPEEGGLLVLNSNRVSPNSIHQITSVGIQPAQQKILVAKGAVAPRAAYEPVCARIIEVDTAGATAINRSASEYRQARQTLYEWEQNS